MAEYHVIHLSRRNLLTLLSKLDRKAQGEDTKCALEKNDRRHPEFPCTTRALLVAHEDEDYYVDRNPGSTREFP